MGLQFNLRVQNRHVLCPCTESTRFRSCVPVRLAAVAAARKPFDVQQFQGTVTVWHVADCFLCVSCQIQTGVIDKARRVHVTSNQGQTSRCDADIGARHHRREQETRPHHCVVVARFVHPAGYEMVTDSDSH